MRRPEAVVTDIEGTTTRISFVHDVLFPYARAHLPAFLTAHADKPALAALIAEVATLAPNQAPLAALEAWMDADAKVTPLKTLQGMIWNEGYKRGELKSEVYADVVPALRRWHAAGVGLYVYSSGSEAAQKLLFGHLPQGDVTPLFSGFFDTRVGAKRAAASYHAIAAAAGLPGAEMLFLSDIGAELDAAAEAGWRTCQLVRAADGTQPAAGHAQAIDFGAVAQLHGLA
jgi:enolase-phosphatase E1